MRPVLLAALLGAAAHAQPTPDDLQAVVRTGNVERLTALLDAGLSPDAEADDIGMRHPMLSAAAAADRPAVVSLLLARGASVTARGAYGATPLHQAASGGPEVVRLLLAAGSDPGALTDENGSVVGSMAFHGNAAGLALVLDAGAAADTPDGVHGPIHRAASPLGSARFGAAPVLRELLARGARADALDPGGRTALHRVAAFGAGTEAMLAAHVLVEAGASAEARDRQGRTPLALAEEAGDDGAWTARYLAGDDDARALAVLLDAVDRCDSSAVVAALPAVRDVDAGEGGDAGSLHSGGTALHLAAARGHAQLVPLLVGAGADVDALDTRGTTPLYAAAARGDLAAVRALLDAGASAGGPADAWPFMGMRPLHEAASSGSAEVVRALLDAGADPLEAMSGGIGLGYDALGFAIAGGHADVVRLLLSAGAEADRMGDTDETPLGLARSLHLDAIAAMLVAAGATE